jgi:putative DNA primase/helicase
VIILSAEDAVNDTIHPRLAAAEADVRRVHVIRAVTELDSKHRRTFNLQRDLHQLEKLIAKIGDVVLVIIDPVSSYMGDRIDGNNMTSVRPVLELVADMAEQNEVAVLLIHHPPKDGGGKAVRSFSGSLAYIAAPRLGFIAVEEKDHEGNETGRKLMLAVKNNLGPRAGGLGYFIKETYVNRENRNGRPIKTTYVEWDVRPVTVSADEALREPTQPSKLDKAIEFLREQLARSAKESGELIAEAERIGISRSTLHRAKNELNISVRKSLYQGESEWELPRAQRRPERTHHVGND